MKDNYCKNHNKNTSDKNIKKQRFSLTLLFSVVVFIVLLVAISIAAVAVFVLVKIGVIEGVEQPAKTSYVILFMVAISALMGAVIAIFGGKFPLKPINNLISNMNSLASGDYKVRMEFGKPITNYPTFVEISDSFNRLAEELQNTEMLRSDFIDNFSHEFKTPIVSIAGLAKLLKKGNLTEEQRIQYLDAIEKESLRLSYMATNVLNLTKVENQTILTEITSFNVSEQIRSCVLLLEDKWSKKEIDLQLDFDEHMIDANEELLKQVWINLIDNAVKFVPEFGIISITIKDQGEYLNVEIGNSGSEIPLESQKKIFNKFYQADESHSTEGNGIGLAIVKRIVDLHHGEVFVESGNGMTAFTVRLPKVHNSKP